MIAEGTKNHRSPHAIGKPSMMSGNSQHLITTASAKKRQPKSGEDEVIICPIFSTV